MAKALVVLANHPPPRWLLATTHLTENYPMKRQGSVSSTSGPLTPTRGLRKEKKTKKTKKTKKKKKGKKKGEKNCIIPTGDHLFGALVVWKP